MGEPTDDDLVARAKTGDKDAFSELYDRHFNWVRNYLRTRGINPDDAVELVQEVFLRAWETLPRFREGQKFGAWLAGITKNIIGTYWRQHYQWQNALPKLAEEFISAPILLQSLEENIDERVILEQIFAQLTSTQKDVLRLRIIEERSTEETAIALYGVDNEANRQKVYSNLYRALMAASQIAKDFLSQDKYPFSDTRKR